MKERVYINANIVYGECLKELAKPNWKRTIRIGVLTRLAAKYALVISVLTQL